MIKTLLLGITGLVGAGAVWAGTTKSRRIQFLRQLVYDGKRDVEPAKFKPEPSQWSDNRISLSWLSHSTVLINFYGVWILTDPVFSERVGPSFGLATIGPKRFIYPALKINELPPIDVILISHGHYDHLDIPSLRVLNQCKNIITAENTSDILSQANIRNSVELGWGEKRTVLSKRGDIEVMAIEVNHWGKRWPDNTNRGYNGYILKREGKSILFAGDTAFTSLFSSYRQYGKYDIAIIPIGAYNPWIRAHCTPEEAIAMANAAGALYIVPVHHKTFKLSDEPLDEPIHRFQRALEKEQERIALRDVGETFILPIV
ncbi:MAG: MBL fold metallo-hydrolase [Verrucomicrobiia bacterium]